MFNQKFFEARQEVKRADHLIYVSLKYTRTIDVMSNILERLISCYDLITAGMMDKLKNEGKIKEEIKIPGLKVEKIKEIYKKESIVDYLTLYIILRKLLNSPKKKMKEFRRGVTMAAEVDNKIVEVTIDIITDYYKKTVEFFEYIQENFSKFLEEEMEE